MTVKRTQRTAWYTAGRKLQNTNNLKPTRELITESDLCFGRRGPAARLLAKAGMRMARLHEINDLYDKTFAYDGPYAEGLLRNLDVTYEANDWGLERIPKTDGCIVAANHPTGALDGIVLIDLLSRLRPDVKFMGNFLLGRIDSLKDFFIDVDPFDATASGNVKGIRQAWTHLQAGGMLVIFPAGEVATWQQGLGQLRDKPWGDSIVRFIRKAALPVVPVYIQARNSPGFHLAGKIHPLLRTALLPRQLLNKRGKHVVVRIASPLTPSQAKELTDTAAFGRFLRANCEYLSPPRERPRRKARRAARKPVDEVARPENRQLLLDELESLRSRDLLFSHGDYEVYLTEPQSIPHLMREIGRQREITFREIGEGTQAELDTDRFDRYYHQLFVWDRSAERLVGAYRLGLGDRIMQRYGLKGFYTFTLFRMRPALGKVLSRTMELGRSFLVSDYQRKPASLMLLWKGILHVLLKHEEFRYLLGPVTISGEFRPASKLALAAFLQNNYLHPRYAPCVKARTGIAVRERIDTSLIEGIGSMELMVKLVGDIENGARGVPILIRKYLDVGSRVLSLNTDHGFSDALDALMLLDLKHVPEKTILMLSKELSDIDVIKRFRDLGADILPGRQRGLRRGRSRESES